MSGTHVQDGLEERIILRMMTWFLVSLVSNEEVSVEGRDKIQRWMRGMSAPRTPLPGAPPSGFLGKGEQSPESTPELSIWELLFCRLFSCTSQLTQRRGEVCKLFAKMTVPIIKEKLQSQTSYKVSSDILHVLTQFSSSLSMYHFQGKQNTLVFKSPGCGRKSLGFEFQLFCLLVV